MSRGWDFSKGIPAGWVTAQQRIALRRLYRHLRQGGCPKWHAVNAIETAFAQGHRAGFAAGYAAGLNWQNKR